MATTVSHFLRTDFDSRISAASDTRRPDAGSCENERPRHRRRRARLIERASTDFSMAAVAAAVGVKTSSLYKRFADREALTARVRRDAYDALRAAVVTGAGRRKGATRIRAMAFAYRDYALHHPQLYALLFTPEERFEAATHAARQAAAAAAVQALADYAGTEHAPHAARTLTAFLHGHVTMLLAGAFKLGGDVEAAFDYRIDRLLLGLLPCGTS